MIDEGFKPCMIGFRWKDQPIIKNIQLLIFFLHHYPKTVNWFFDSSQLVVDKMQSQQNKKNTRTMRNQRLKNLKKIGRRSCQFFLLLFWITVKHQWHFELLSECHQRLGFYASLLCPWPAKRKFKSEKDHK